MMPHTALIWKNLTIRSCGALLHENASRDLRAIAYIRDGITQGYPRPVIAKKFRLDEIVEAARFFGFDWAGWEGCPGDSGLIVARRRTRNSTEALWRAPHKISEIYQWTFRLITSRPKHVR